MKQFLKINGKVMIAPKEISLSYEDLDKAERTVDGTMVVDMVGRKQRVDVSWEYLSKEDMAILARETKTGSFVTVTYHDTITGTLQTITARPRDFTYLPFYDWVKGKIMWKTVAISFVER